MKQIFKPALYILIVTICANGTLLQAGERGSLYSEQNLLTFYTYDKTQPFEATFDTVGTLLAHYKIKLTFNSIHQEKVPAYLYMPVWASPSTPTPCVFWIHSYGMNKEIPDEAFLLLSPLGYAFLSLDIQYHGDRSNPTKEIFSLDLVQTRYAFAQTVIDHLRALDFLETLPQIDSNRIGLIGGSLGGIIGAMVTALDDRIKVSVLISAGGGWTEILKVSDLLPAEPLRTYVGDHFQLIDRLLDPVDPLLLMHRVQAPQALQMHHGEKDITVPYATGKALYEKAGPPKQFYSYPGKDHYSLVKSESLILVLRRTIDWLKRYL